MKKGLKMWSRNENMMENAVQLINDKIFDYIEIMPLPRSKPDFFLNYDVEFILHFTSENFDFNLGDMNNQEYNKNIIDLNISWANALKVKNIIIHPGFGDLNVVKQQLLEINDDRLYIENMPYYAIKGGNLLGYSVDEINQLRSNKFGFCLDIGHAVKSAKYQKIPILDFIDSLLKLKPNIIHFSDGDSKILIDEHLHLGVGNYPLDKIKKMIEKQRIEYLTFETPRENYTSFNDDLSNLKYYDTL